jgi:tetratricopeptide (TPR) repeat protein
MNASKTKVLLVIGAIILFVLLFIAPKIAPDKPKSGGDLNSQTTQIATNATLDVYVGLAKKVLSAEQKKVFDKLSSENKNDSLAAFWDRLKKPDIASFYLEKKASKAEDWFKAGNRYYYAVQFCQDKTEIPVLYQCAMRCFGSGLKTEPNNTEAKIMLASCYVEGTSDPMQGVSRLREIEKTDSNNVKLQLTFAFFSLKSNQLDRAIKRFNKVIAIDSMYIEAYLHLADAYEQLGETDKTISALESYAQKTDDPTARIEINKYIQQLKQK